MKKRTGKILALLLSLTMMAGVIAGCGSEKTDGSADSTSTQAATDAQEALDTQNAQKSKKHNN